MAEAKFSGPKAGLAGLALAGAVLALTLSTPAAADGWSLGLNSHGGITFSFYGGYHPGYYNKRHLYRRHTPYYGRHTYRPRRHGPHITNNYYYNSGPSYGPGYAPSRACQPVSKTGYWHGRKAKIGGTMCYDAYGNGYIVNGSRYLIHYY